MVIPENFLTEIFNEFIRNMNIYTGKMLLIIGKDFSIFARAFVALYIAYFGVNLVMGKFGDRKNDILTSIILLIVLHTVIVESNLYLKLLKGYLDFVMNIAGYFIEGSADSKGIKSGLEKMFSSFGPVLDSTTELMTPSASGGGFMSFFKLLPMRALAILAFILILICFSIYLILCLLSIFGIYLLFIIGAVPVFFAAFKETRHIFFAWFKAVINDGLIIIIASVFIAVCIHGLENTINDFMISYKKSGSAVGFGYITLVIYCTVTCGILLKSPDYASSITGASSGSSSTIAGGIVFTAGKFIKGGYKTVTGGGGKQQA